MKKETLLEQAKRLYPVGTKFKNAIVKYNGFEYTVTKYDPEEVASGIINISATGGTHGRACIYYKDKWAEIVKEETLLEQAKRLYPIGTRYKTAGYSEDEYVVEKQTFEHANGDIRGEVCKGILYRNGKWAEIVSEAKQQSYIQPANKNTVMSATQTATRAQLKSIHSKVCSKWQSRIEETIKLDMFADSFEIPNGLITQAFDEADKDQTALLLKIFTKPDNGYVILATGDEFKANVFEVENIVIGKGAVSKEFKGKSIIFDSSKYEAIIMPNKHSAGKLDAMIVFKKK
jgi:hypothetical protein